MASDRLSIPLEKKTDANGGIYYLGRLKAPVSINCSEGVALLIFTSEEGNEELQISHITKPKNKAPENNGKVENEQ